MTKQDERCVHSLTLTGNNYSAPECHAVAFDVKYHYFFLLALVG